MACAIAPAWAGGPQLNDYGETGLLQTPSARMMDDGEFRANGSVSPPYNRLMFSAQPLPWAEAQFRYTFITNRLFGPREFSGNQRDKDRSIGGKIRLVQESDFWPAIAVGLRDVGGTGLFSSEYLVASRRVYDFDVTLGLGWGRIGSRGVFRNPFSLISDRFNERNQDSKRGGTVNASSFFSGRNVGLFGGVQWYTPIRNLILTVEYDGNDYKSEPLNDNQKVDSPVNFGLDYRLFKRLDLGVGLERGNTFMFKGALAMNFEQDRGPAKYLDPPPVPVKRRETLREPASVPSPPETGARVRERGRSPGEAALSPNPSPASGRGEIDEAVVDRLRSALAEQGIALYAVTFQPEQKTLQIWYGQATYRNPAKAVGRTARALAAIAPSDYEVFTLVDETYGMQMNRVTLLREDLERGANLMASPEEILAHAQIENSTNEPPSGPFSELVSYPYFRWGTGPGLIQHVGSANGFWFGEFLWRLGADWSLTPHLVLSSGLKFNLYNNFNGLKQTSNSELPHVRSDIVRYIKEGKNGVEKLETNYFWSPVPEWYARVSAGIFETMYGGAGGEVLYRPYHRRWALGLDANHVWQRQFDQRFSFRDYNVTTGHLTLYYDLPVYDILAQISGGRYLARDRGFTFDLSREFAGGARMGIFWSITNVSARKFGEGSFDKGFYIALPFDWFFPHSTASVGTLLFRLLTRDGGQKVRDGAPLYPLTEKSDYQGLLNGWQEILQ